MWYDTIIIIKVEQKLSDLFRGTHSQTFNKVKKSLWPSPLLKLKACFFRQVDVGRPQPVAAKVTVLYVVVHLDLRSVLTIIGRGWAKYLDLSLASSHSLRLRQIIDLWDTDKSRYFAITEFNNCFIIRSPSLFFKWISSGSEAICHFHARTIARRRKARFALRMRRILFAAKHFTGEKCLIGRRATTWHCQVQNGGNTSIVCLFQ